MRIKRVLLFLIAIFPLMIIPFTGRAETNSDDFFWYMTADTSPGRAVTLKNNCSVDIAVGGLGNNMMKYCSTNADCGGGKCDHGVNPAVCTEVYCGLHSDCFRENASKTEAQNAYCGGVTSYGGTCAADKTNQCGPNRFCDAKNRNYKSATSDCPKSTDQECIDKYSDQNYRCDKQSNRCYFNLCGWKSCIHVPLPITNAHIVIPEKECSSNKDCCTTANNVTTCPSFCYVSTSSGKGKCAKVPTENEGNYWAMSAAINSVPSTQTVTVPVPWAGRFWPRTGCKDDCKDAPPSWCQINKDCLSNVCETSKPPRKAFSCTSDDQCDSTFKEKCDTRTTAFPAIPPAPPDTQCTDECTTNSDCDTKYANEPSVPGPSGKKHMVCVTKKINCGEQGVKDMKRCGFHQCYNYQCQTANICSFKCDTGQCNGDDGKTPSRYCRSSATQYPTLAELFAPGTPGTDYYDISLVDGGNMPVQITPDTSSYSLDGGQTDHVCSTDSDCLKIGDFPEPYYSCEVPAGSKTGKCVNRYWCSSPGCTDDCATYGYGKYLAKSTWNLTPPFAVAETTCPSELQYKGSNSNKYAACMAPKDACALSNPAAKLKCTESTGQGSGTYLNLYECSGPNAGSCYTNTTDPYCCGCASWMDQKFCLAGSNSVWVTNANPYHKIFHDISPTSYAFPYDDKSGTFVCTGKKVNEVVTSNVNYTITFCPK